MVIANNPGMKDWDIRYLNDKSIMVLPGPQSLEVMKFDALFPEECK